MEQPFSKWINMAEYVAKDRPHSETKQGISRGKWISECYSLSVRARCGCEGYWWNTERNADCLEIQILSHMCCTNGGFDLLENDCGDLLECESRNLHIGDKSNVVASYPCALLELHRCWRTDCISCTTHDDWNWANAARGLLGEQMIDHNYCRWVCL